MIKKLLKIFGVLVILILVFIGGLSIWVYYNQDTIMSRLTKMANENFNGELHVDKVAVAPFVNFPYISIDLKNVRYYDNKDRQGRPVYHLSDVYVGFDIKDLIKGNYNIRKVTVSDGDIHLIRDSVGKLNLVQSKNLGQEETSVEDIEEGSQLLFDLEAITFKDIFIEFDDEYGDKEYDFRFSLLESKIRSAKDHYFIDIESQFVLDYIEGGDTTFFYNKPFEIAWTLDYFTTLQQVIVERGKIKIGDAQFLMTGCADFGEELDLDLYLSGDKSDFSLITAFAPPEVEALLNQYQNAGRVFFNGRIMGLLTRDVMPRVEVNFGCENVFILNKAVNRRIEDLQFYGYFSNGESRNLETAVLRINNFNARPEEGIFQGNIIIRNFIDPFINIDLHADLDLEFLGSFFQVEGLRQLQGQILLDMKLDELIDLNFADESLARLKQGVDSELTIKNLQFRVPDYPHPISNVNGHAQMENGEVLMDSLVFTIGDETFYLNGTLSDLPALFHRYEEEVDFELTARAPLIDLAYLSGSTDTLSSTWAREVIEDFRITFGFAGMANELFDYEYLPLGSFQIEDFYAKLKYFPHAFHDFHAKVLIQEDRLDIDHFRGEVDQSDFQFSGSVENYKKWFQEKPTGDSKFSLDLTSNLLVLNDLLTYKGENYLPEDYIHEEVRFLKSHIDIDLHYKDSFESADLYIRHLKGKMNIHPLKIEHVIGHVFVNNTHMKVNDLYCKMGVSDILLNMTYALDESHTTKETPNKLSLVSKVLDLDALMNYEGPDKEVDHEAAVNYFELPFPNLNFNASIGRMNYHQYWLENVTADVKIRENHFVYVDTLDFDVADGHLAMRGYFNGEDPDKIYYNSKIRTKDLDIDKLMIKFDNFGQDELINENIHGRISGTVESTFRMHPDLTPIIEESEAHMELIITEGSIVNFTPMQAMSRYFDDKNLNLIRFDTLQNVLDLKDGNLTIPSMNINSTLGFIEVSGRQGVDMSMDYFVRVPLRMATKVGWRAVFKSKNKDEIDPDQIDDIIKRDTTKRVRFLNLKVTGTTEDFKVSVGRDKSGR